MMGRKRDNMRAVRQLARTCMRRNGCLLHGREKMENVPCPAEASPEV
jgi:hypothetical protein